MVLSDEKRQRIEKLVKAGVSQNEIMKLCHCGKNTVRNIRRALDGEGPKNQTGTLLVSIEDIDNYVKSCLNNPKKTPNTALLNTAIKLLEFKNKVEPEHLKRSEERERVKFEDTLKDAMNYVHTLKPDYQVTIPVIPGSDDKTSGVEG